MQKVLDCISKVIEKICFVLMAVMTLVTFAQAFNRYVLNGSFFWAEECAIWSMIWVTMLGSCVAMHRKSHTRIDFLINMLPIGVRKWVEVFDYIIIAVFLGFLGWYSLPVIQKTGRLISTGMKLPRSIMFWAILIGCIIMVLDCLNMAVKTALRKPEEVYGK